MAYKPLKLWFDGELADLLSSKLKNIFPDFDRASFKNEIKKQIPELELKDRVEVIADQLNKHLIGAYPQKIDVLIQILGPENENETGMFTEYYWVMPIAKFVEKYGLNDPEISFQAMEEITKRNTSEYAIRPFLVKYPDLTLSKLMNWTESENKHIRRLASEGGRPRLPWAKKLDQFIDDPAPLLPILRKLKDDPSKYVQKSVANCLNDILKDNSEVAKAEIESWLPSNSKERKWIIKHAIRNLRKNEDSWAIKIMDEL